ncbi:DNA polymerase III subunit beta [Paenibacillus hemerocallicola]|uniref:Beta sliding clamp n=1 Tax=Paenibacillus hemerocallicola TaxID=1172614 RepID=A0A5C4SZF9_9BACL|nr:DNA polymerase III subunit beta [Paenibacillus hemerocallicola]TNJ62083.1 DNA polymerase III subunit beta [Paenibacillus hemerocallicola]
MKLNILKEHLNESIQHVTKAISSRTTIPILTGIKIDVDTDGVTLTASDTEISIQSHIPIEKEGNEIVQILTPGSVVLPAKFFTEIIKKLPSSDVTIEVKDNFITWISSGSAEIQIVGLDPEEYPLLPQLEENNIVSVSSELLKTMIRQTTFAVSTSETSPILTGVLWSFSRDRLKLIACDRLRMASREAQIEAEGEIEFHNIVIAGKSLNELNKLLPDQNMPIDIVVANNQVLFKIDRIQFYTRILDGAYPDTSKLIPQSFQTHLTIDTRKLADAIDRAYLLSREEKTNIVKMTLKDEKTVEISSSSSELGKVTEQIDTHKLDGDLLSISFNSKYMLDALKVIDSDFIQICFRGPMQPIIMKPEDHSNMLHLIMPYRTTT